MLLIVLMELMNAHGNNSFSHDRFDITISRTDLFFSTGTPVLNMPHWEVICRKSTL